MSMTLTRAKPDKSSWGTHRTRGSPDEAMSVVPLVAFLRTRTCEALRPESWTYSGSERRVVATAGGERRSAKPLYGAKRVLRGCKAMHTHWSIRWW